MGGWYHLDMVAWTATLLSCSSFICWLYRWGLGISAFPSERFCLIASEGDRIHDDLGITLSHPNSGGCRERLGCVTEGVALGCVVESMALGCVAEGMARIVRGPIVFLLVGGASFPDGMGGDEVGDPSRDFSLGSSKSLKKALSSLFILEVGTPCNPKGA